MNTRRWFVQTGVILLALLFGLAGCIPAKAPALPPTAVPPAPTLTPLATLSLDQASATGFKITDFDAVHSPVNGDANQYLILGSLPISKPAADLPPELAAFLGRWEGYSYAPPVKKDNKIVLAIQEITAQGGTAKGWWGTNLQYPGLVGETRFRVVPGDQPSIEFQISQSNGIREIATFSYDNDKDLLIGWLKYSANKPAQGPFELSRSRSFSVYKDYPQYLAGKSITPKTYQNSDLQSYGNQYLLYLPEGYAEQPEKTWPLILFFHGYGDRGDNVFLLAKASPFMYIREKGPLPFIIAAPLLNASAGNSLFPDAYLDGVLAEIQAEYRVDAKRIYATGLSIGGEATYRFAVNQPETFAAIAPLSAYVESKTFSRIDLIKDLPVWAIHGADDTVVPLAKGQQPADALEAAGGNIKFSVLPGHDHDTWTDTYSDPAFYEWFLQYQKP